MKRISLLFFTLVGLSAADALTVDPSGKVGIGTATPTSTLDVAGTTTATNVIVNRATQAAATEAVRGDDPRMTNARPANGGNAATVGGLAPSAFVATAQKGAANGVATLDASGKIPATQLSSLGGGALPKTSVFATPGTSSFVVPAGITRVGIVLLGAGGGGAGGSSGGAPDGGPGDAGGASSITGSFGTYVAGGGGGGVPNSTVASVGGTFSGPGLVATPHPLPLVSGVTSVFKGLNGVDKNGGNCPDLALGLGVTGGGPGGGALGYGGGGGGVVTYADDGNGNYYVAYNGTPGASGAVIRCTVTVTSGETLTIVTGAAGLGGYPDNNGNNHADRAPAFSNGSLNGNYGGGGGGDGLGLVSW